MSYRALAIYHMEVSLSAFDVDLTISMFLKCENTKKSFNIMSNMDCKYYLAQFNLIQVSKALKRRPERINTNKLKAGLIIMNNLK